MSSIDIAVDNTTATLTSPLSVFKRKIVVYPTAVVTTLRRGEEPVNLPEIYPIPFRFILDLVNEPRPPCIHDGLSKAVISCHPLHVQVFGKDSLVFAYQPMTQFVKEIASLVGNLFMNKGDFPSCLIPVYAALHLSGKTALKKFQLIFRSTKKLWRLNALARRSYKERFQPKVNSDLRATVFQINLLFNLAKQRRKVFTRGGFLDSHTLNSSFNFPVNDYLKGGYFRNSQCPLDWIEFECLRHCQRLPCLFFLEGRKLSVFIEKVVVSCVKMTKRLLEYLRIRLLEPCGIGLLFQFRKHLGRVVIIKTLLFTPGIGRIKVNALAKEEVIHKASLPKVNRKQGGLFLGWIYPKLVCFVNQHAYRIHEFL